MSRYAKITLSVGLLLAFYGTSAYPDEEPTPSVETPAPEPAPAATPPPAQVKPEPTVNAPKLWLDTPWFKGYVPGVQVSVISLYDLIQHRALVGAETSLFGFKRITFTGGGITSVGGEGSPYIGGHLLIPNPVPSLVFLNDLQIGGWGGRDFHIGKWIAGLKAGKQIW